MTGASIITATKSARRFTQTRATHVAPAHEKLHLLDGSSYDVLLVDNRYLGGAVFRRNAFVLEVRNARIDWNAVSHVREHRTSHVKWFPVARVTAAIRKPGERTATPTRTPKLDVLPTWWHPYRSQPAPPSARPQHPPEPPTDRSRYVTAVNPHLAPVLSAHDQLIGTTDEPGVAIFELAEVVGLRLDTVYNACERLERDGVFVCLTPDTPGRRLRRYTRRTDAPASPATPERDA